jgi:hypothetical protein
MEHDANNGEGWRINLQKELVDLEIVWLDPTQKPTKIALENESTKHILHELREKEDFKLLREMMIPIRSYDLRMVDISDFLVVHLDLNIPTCGTWEEIFIANKQKKPIILHMEQGKKKIPYWLFSVIPEQLLFDDWNEVYKYIRHIANDVTVDDLNRWRFFDFSLGRKFK